MQEQFIDSILTLFQSEEFVIVNSNVIVLEDRKLKFCLFESKDEKKCSELVDFKCINIWRDQWYFSPQIIKSRVNSLLGKNHKLPARVCEIKRIDKKTADDFLNLNHLQGSPFSKIKYGLFLPKKYFRLLPPNFNAPNIDLLIGVMTFSGPKKFYFEEKIINSFELIRFGTLLNFNVIGGFSKLLKYFIEDKNPGNIMTYVDADWSDGANFVKMGFRLESKFPPNHYKLNAENKRVRVDEGEQYEVYNQGSYKFILDVEK